MAHQFLIMWCSDGLEYVADITADEQRVMWESLQGRESPRHAYANPFHLMLRARHNQERHYEIYFINVDEGITPDDIREMFNASPQTAADAIREKGECFYNGRRDTNPPVIV